jgi:hypothetical protein
MLMAEPRRAGCFMLERLVYSGDRGNAPKHSLDGMVRLLNRAPSSPLQAVCDTYGRNHVEGHPSAPV